MNKKLCIIIVGPTAVGKTSMAIRIAQEFDTCIISADSRQCYKELNIGVAKPSSADLLAVTHYFINSHTIHEEVNAALFEQYALACVETIFQNSNLAVITGGTGLYINAFCDGMDEIPVILPEVRNNIRKGFEHSGLEWLQNQVQQNDPGYYQDGEMLNPQRLMRSLEVKLSTGRSIRAFQSKQKKNRPFDIIKIGLDLPRELLYNNINSRVDTMIRHGLEEEVRSLLPYRHLNALNTVGYKEFFNYFDGTISRNQAIDAIKLSTRRYAKRQVTWFRNDNEIVWFQAGNINDILQHCRHKSTGYVLHN